jgi:glycosyltransferase involved in cell wall biosynthesis
MFNNMKVVVVMPAYNAEKTLRMTYEEVMAQGVVDLVVVVDDASHDQTVQVAETLDKVRVHVHPQNMGYGANQKSCYRLALEEGADIVVMVHPDYQYTPKLIPAMVALIGNGLYSCVIGSRILGGRAIRDGMPAWRYVSNRFLTLWGNVLMGAKLSEYHSGYRAFSGDLLRQLPLDRDSDDFIFDNQMLAQVIWLDYVVGEVSCPAKYFSEGSSINFRRSVKYGFGCLATAAMFRLAKWGLIKSRLLPRVPLTRREGETADEQTSGKT